MIIQELSMFYLHLYIYAYFTIILCAGGEKWWWIFAEVNHCFRVYHTSGKNSAKNYFIGEN